MPIFEYDCEKCGSEFELLVCHDQPPVCPNCGTNRLLKRVQRAGGSCEIEPIVANLRTTVERRMRPAAMRHGRMRDVDFAVPRSPTR